MNMKIIYIANDGKEFKTERECAEYEENCRREKEEAILKEAVIIDSNIWKKYCSTDTEETDTAPVQLAIIWLKEDIIHILSNAENSDETEQEILEYIKAREFGNKIINKLNLADIKEEVTIRRDYATAFRRVRKGRELSHVLRYSFGDNDLKKLAILHKARKFRKKIEELLEDCNFHTESADFSEGQYDKYINIA